MRKLIIVMLPLFTFGLGWFAKDSLEPVPHFISDSPVVYRLTLHPDDPDFSEPMRAFVFLGNVSPKNPLRRIHGFWFFPGEQDSVTFYEEFYTDMDSGTFPNVSIRKHDLVLAPLSAVINDNQNLYMNLMPGWADWNHILTGTSEWNEEFTEGTWDFHHIGGGFRLGSFTLERMKVPLDKWEGKTMDFNQPWFHDQFER